MRPESPRILVIGALGQVGWELMRTLAPLGQVEGTRIDGQHGHVLDLTRPGKIAALLDQLRPDALVNAAAYTAVDRAESERELAFAVNAEAVGEIGRIAAARDIPVIHYSTDFVFSGEATRPYREDDPTGPLSVYGESKLAGEQALLESGARALIFRTAWVYGVRGQNFLLTMRRLFREREEVRVVDDQIGSPTPSRLIAEATAQVLGRILAGEPKALAARGVYHLTAAGSTSWHGFASAIREGLGAECRVTPIPTRDYPTPARRPAWSVLDNGRLREELGLVMPEWRVALGLCLADLTGP